MFDVVIVGAGPAGSAAALAALRADPACRVLLVDRCDFPRERACGGLLTRDAVRALVDLGVGHVLSGARPPQGMPVRLHVAGAGRVAAALPDGVGVLPRHLLDARLVKAAVEAGAQFAQVQVDRVEQDALGVRVHAVGGGVVQAGYVIAADGAGSRVRASLGLPPAGSAVSGVAGVVRVPLGQRVLDRWELLTGGQGPTPNLAWAVPMAGGTVSVGYVHAGDAPVPAAARAAELLGPLVDVAGVEWVEVTGAVAAGAPGPLVHGRVMLTGDAAGLANPLTGAGVGAAVRSGMLAGHVAGSKAAPWEFEGAAVSVFAAHAQQAAELSAGMKPALLVSSVRAARDDDRVADGLVDLVADAVPVDAAVLRAARRTALLGRLRPGRRSDVFDDESDQDPPASAEGVAAEDPTVAATAEVRVAEGDVAADGVAESSDAAAGLDPSVPVSPASAVDPVAQAEHAAGGR